MPEVDEVEVPITADASEFERVLRKAQREQERFENETEEKSKEGGGSRGAFLGGAVGGFVGGAIGAAVAGGPIGQLLGSIGTIFTALLTIILLPVIQAILPILADNLPAILKAAQDISEDVGTAVDHLADLLAVFGDDPTAEEKQRAEEVATGIGSRLFGETLKSLGRATRRDIGGLAEFGVFGPLSPFVGLGAEGLARGLEQTGGGFIEQSETFLADPDTPFHTSQIDKQRGSTGVEG